MDGIVAVFGFLGLLVSLLFGALAGTHVAVVGLGFILLGVYLRLGKR